MAHAHKHVRMEPVTVEQEVVKGIVLELTVEEAEFIYDLLGCCVLGDNASRRRHADAIWGALRRLVGCDTDSRANDIRGHIEVTRR